jgi:dipeptidyl aminopeptidase/acylaminoacyl peptidase
MLNRFKRLFLFLAMLTFVSCVNKNVHLIPIGDFFNTPQKSVFHISPDGKYISYLKLYQGKQNLCIQTLADGRERMGTSFADYNIRDYFWTFNNRIIFTKFRFEANQFQMFVMDAASFKIDTLLSIHRVKFQLLNRNRNNPDVITFSMNKRDSTTFDVYRLNTKTGHMQMYLQNPGNITKWYPDADGRIRLVKSSDGVNETILFRPDEQSPFRKIIVNNFKNTVEPYAFTGYKNYFYALSNVNRDKTALVEINAENGQEEKIIYGSEQADIEELVYSKNKQRLEMVAWEGAKPEKYFLNNEVKEIYGDLAKQLPGNELRISDRDSAEHNLLISTYNDRNPGSYYLYNVEHKKLLKLADVNPDINPADLCEMKPVSFKATDGVQINGYLTLPLTGEAQNLPVVVIPHMDPWRRNSWGYSAEVQFLANRGYAVFQVNYRGSTGYGKSFHSVGFKQIGGKMQQDITDGVNWLIAKKIANPKKIALFGTGFGGFSALYGVSTHPDLYACAAVQFPLINFFTYIKDVPPFFKPYLSMMYEMVGSPETDADMFKTISPVFNAQNFKSPLLIYQGARDPHVNILELNQFVRELRKNKVAVNYILNKDKDRQHDKNRLRLYTELEKFLDVNLLKK